jgi:hypothetical protein
MRPHFAHLTNVPSLMSSFDATSAFVSMLYQLCAEPSGRADTIYR